LGNWTVLLQVNKEGRFPNIASVIPDAESITSRLHLTPSDAAFLEQVLPRLPHDDDQHHAITLDLGDQIAVRAKPQGEGRPTEVVLSGSRHSGAAVTISLNRKYLGRALKLGFREIGVKDVAAPLVCSDERRQYVWALLYPEDTVRASDDAVRIASPIPGTDAVTIPIPKTRKRSHATMSESSTTPAGPVASASETVSANGTAASSAANGTVPKVHQPRSRKPGRPSTATALEQAIALRDSLRRQAGQAGDLVRAIKRQRREAQLVQSTLASLKQFQAA